MKLSDLPAGKIARRVALSAFLFTATGVAASAQSADMVPLNPAQTKQYTNEFYKASKIAEGALRQVHTGADIQNLQKRLDAYRAGAQNLSPVEKAGGEAGWSCLTQQFITLLQSFGAQKNVDVEPGLNAIVADCARRWIFMAGGGEQVKVPRSVINGAPVAPKAAPKALQKIGPPQNIVPPATKKGVPKDGQKILPPADPRVVPKQGFVSPSQG